MTTLDFAWTTGPSWLHRLMTMFRRPVRVQIAALCYRKSSQGMEVLLVTSRGRGRWILPKGWPKLKKAAHATAAAEAFEEAGIVGAVEHEPFAHFRAEKLMDGGLSVPTRVDVYLIRVENQVQDFPEAGQRAIAWVPVDKAIEMADEPGAKRVLKRFKDKLAKKSLG